MNLPTAYNGHVDIRSSAKSHSIASCAGVDQKVRAPAATSKPSTKYRTGSRRPRQLCGCFLISMLNIFAFRHRLKVAVPMYHSQIEAAHESYGSSPVRASAHNTEIGFFKHRRGACCTQARNI
jgi:hypothetical protein